MRYFTEYPVGRAKFGSAIHAENADEATEICEARGLGEKVVGLDDGFSLSATLSLGPSPEARHAAIWLGFLALKSGVADVDEILGDAGLIHQLVHMESLRVGDDSYERELSKIVKHAKRLEKRIPGLLP